MSDYFDHPEYLGLLLLLPLLWGFSYRSLSGLGTWRRCFAISLRTLVFVLVVLALAEAQYRRVSDRMTVIYLLDQSESIPAEQRTAMVDFVKESVREFRDVGRRDRAALIIFGRDANIEVPPLDADLPVVGYLESLFDLRTDATNLAAAMKLAQATFPEDSSRRVVVVTDGNENVGDADSIAELLSAGGVGIDVVPIRIGNRPEVFVERVTLPTGIRKGQPLQIRSIVTNLSQPSEFEPGDVPGKLRLSRRAGNQVETLREENVVLNPGKNVFSFSNQIEQADFYEYQVEFEPQEDQHDLIQQNNRATAFTHVQGSGHVLLIEDWEHPGEFDYLVGELRELNIEVTVQASDRLFASLADLQRYDSVILANVPRTSGDESQLSNFSDAQINMLLRNTADSGCGLIMLGGPQSFGAGGWANTALEKAMPVDFTINNAKVVPVGALAMVMHASEMARGNFWQKQIAIEALKSLGGQDYCGVIHWTGTESWLWQFPAGLAKVGSNRREMLARMGRMTPGDMPDFDPSLKLAAAGFRKCTEAATKHMIVISDGDPQAASSAVLQEFVDQGIKISTVAVGTHGPAGHAELERIAQATGGRYYVVTDPRQLPRIFQREARRVARPLVKEGLFQPRITARHEILQGIDSSPPPISGFVLTQVKQNNLVEVLMTSPEPQNARYATLLAAWTYQFGRSAVLTTDAGYRWADRWTQWSDYDKLFSQLVRWSMRPIGDQGKFTVATQSKEGKVRVVVTALDKNDELLNFLSMSASVVGPDVQSRPLAMRQTAPGRYVGEFETQQAGSYFVTLLPGQFYTPIRAGVNVPYAAEFRDRETNMNLLNRLVERQPSGGAVGRMIKTEMTSSATVSEEANSFRRDLARAISNQSIWPQLVLLSCCLFLADVFVRRVHVGFGWLQPFWGRVLSMVGADVNPPAVDERMERLRQRKRQVEGSLRERRAATRFTPDVNAVDDDRLDIDLPSTKSPSQSPEISPSEDPEDDAMSRLLRAKRDALRDRNDKSKRKKQP